MPPALCARGRGLLVSARCAESPAPAAPPDIDEDGVSTAAVATEGEDDDDFFDREGSLLVVAVLSVLLVLAEAATVVFSSDDEDFEARGFLIASGAGGARSTKAGAAVSFTLAPVLLLLLVSLLALPTAFFLAEVPLPDQCNDEMSSVRA